MDATGLNLCTEDLMQLNQFSSTTKKLHRATHCSWLTRIIKQFVKKLLRELLKNKKKRRRKFNYLQLKQDRVSKVLHCRPHISTSAVLDIPSHLLQGVLFDLNLQSSKLSIRFLNTEVLELLGIIRRINSCKTTFFSVGIKHLSER